MPAWAKNVWRVPKSSTSRQYKFAVGWRRTDQPGYIRVLGLRTFLPTGRPLARNWAALPPLSFSIFRARSQAGVAPNALFPSIVLGQISLESWRLWPPRPRFAAEFPHKSADFATSLPRTFSSGTLLAKWNKACPDRIQKGRRGQRTPCFSLPFLLGGETDYL